jgi:hypothetical protein
MRPRYHAKVKEYFMRLSVAATASLGTSLCAYAGTIEGTLTFPSQLVPPMTAYAFELDTARIRSVQLSPGQAGFRVDVPAGRYQVFLAPNEPGAPNIYGAYTQYSLCSEHESEASCIDHNLVTVTISAKAPRAAVKVNDWYLTDDIDDQIDHIRGIATNANTEPLSAPRFSEYPSPRTDTPVPAIDFGDTLSVEQRAAVLQAMANGPNFAGYLTAAVTRCGSACTRVALIDWRSGTLHDPAALAEISGTLPCRADEALLFRRDSRLLIVTRNRGAAVLTQYYVWNPADSSLVLNAEYELAAPAFCAGSAR